jgi:hypothetical protein
MLNLQVSATVCGLITKNVRLDISSLQFQAETLPSENTLVQYIWESLTHDQIEKDSNREFVLNFQCCVACCLCSASQHKVIITLLDHIFYLQSRMVYVDVFWNPITKLLQILCNITLDEIPILKTCHCHHHHRHHHPLAFPLEWVILWQSLLHSSPSSHRIFHWWLIPN